MGLQSKKAFTLVELIAVIAIIAILLVLVVPAISGVGSNSRVSLRDSKIRTMVTASEKYGNEVINEYQNCLGTTDIDDLIENCTLSPQKLLEYGYLENDDILDPVSNKIMSGNILFCYDPANVNVYASYIEDDNYSCKDISINSNNSLSLSSVGGVGYVGGKEVEVSIIKSGDFKKFECSSSNDNLARCSIADNKLRMDITDDKTIDFGDKIYEEVEIGIRGYYDDDDGNSLNLSKTYKLKVYPTGLKIVEDGKTCIPVGSGAQNTIDALNAGVMSVTSSDKEIIDGTAKDGMLYISTYYKAGPAKLTIWENNGNNSVEITKNVYSLTISEEFPENMVINHYVDIPIEYRGTGKIKITSSNPDVLRFSSDRQGPSAEIVLDGETSFRVTANKVGMTKVTIEGENCGREVRDVSVSSLSFKNETRGLVYIGGERRNVEIQVEEAHDIECISSDPEAATCEVHATTVVIIPGSKSSDNVTLTVGSVQVGYAYYHLQVLRTSIDVVNSSGRALSTVCREKNTSYNSDQVFVRGVNLGDTEIYEVEDWYLAEASVAKTGLQRNLTVYPRIGTQYDPPYVLGENTGRTKIEVKENNGNRIAHFNYNIYSLTASENAATLEVDETIDFEIEASATGEIYVTTSNSDVATAVVTNTGNFDWTPNAVNRRTVRVTATGTGVATISVHGADCGVTTFNVKVDGKNLFIRLQPGTYTTSLGSEMLSCETEGLSRSCNVTFPVIRTSSEFSVVGYSATKDSTTATYKPGDKYTITYRTNGSTFYGNSRDLTKPVCSIPDTISSVRVGEEVELSMTCIDTGSGIDGNGALTEDNFAISDATFGELISVGNPVQIANGFSYKIKVRSKKVGLFGLSLKANAVVDKFKNGNSTTVLQNIFASEYEEVEHYYIGKTIRENVVAIIYDNEIIGSGTSGTYSLYVYGNGEMLDFRSSSYVNYAPWYEEYRSTITNVVINEGVTSVGTYFGYNSTSLKSVTFASTVKKIGSNAFANADLSSIIVPNAVTVIEANAFYGNKNLTAVSLGSSLVSIGTGAFYNHHVANLTIPDAVTSIGENAFGVEPERSVIASLQFGSNSRLTSIGNSAFIYHKLTSLNVPGSVNSIGNRAFEQIDVASGTLKNLTFADDANLISIGDDAFAYAALNSLSLPNSLQNIGARAFAALRDGVTTINLGKNVRTIGDNFAYGSDLAIINVESGNAYYTSIDGILYNKTKSTLVKCPDDYYLSHISLDVPSTVRTIQAGAFDGWLNYDAGTGLTINLPSNIVNMNIADNFIFYKTSAINISGNGQFDSIDGVLFNKDRSIIYRLPLAYDKSSYVIPDTVMTVADYFSYGNSRVSAIEIPETVTRIGLSAFATDTNYAFSTINLNAGDSLYFDESSFSVMVYSSNESLSSRVRTINVVSTNLKSRLENMYSGVLYGLNINKVGE